MKVLHLSAVKTFGGGENHILNLCGELKNCSEIENIVLSVKNSALSGILQERNIKNFSAPLRIKFDLRYVFRIISICKKENIDLIHIHDPTALTLAVTASRLAKLPAFVFSKKTSFPIKNRKSTLYKYKHEKIKKILCVSEETRRIAGERIRDHEKLVTIYHGTSLDKSAETPFLLRKKLNIPENKIIVGSIANHIRAKNLETWIRLVDHVINRLKRTDLHFVLIGDYTKRTPAYGKMISELNLEAYVSITGFLPNASNFIPQFDISLLTSQSEGVPQFIYESFYHKVPVVSTNVGGISEIIKDGKNGFISPPFEPMLLAENLIALCGDKLLQQKFVENSHKKLQENFTTSIMARKTLAEYKNVLYGKNG